MMLTRNIRFRLGKIDTSYEGTYRRFSLDRYAPRGFPLLVTFRNGVESSYYMGPPDAADIVEYILTENPMEVSTLFATSNKTPPPRYSGALLYVKIH